MRSTISAAQSHFPCELRDRGIHSKCGCPGNAAPARGHRLLNLVGEPGSISVDVRALWWNSRDAAARIDAVLSQKSLRSGQALRLRIVAEYRQAYGMHASNGKFSSIMKARLRGETFVTRKINACGGCDRSRAQDRSLIGNSRCEKGLGTRPRVCSRMWLIAAAGGAGRLRAGKGESTRCANSSSAPFRKSAFRSMAGRRKFRARRDANSGRVLVEVDPRYFARLEADHLLGEASKARQRLGWRHETNFESLVFEMVREEPRQHRKEHRRRDD